MTGSATTRWCVHCGNPVGEARFCVHCGNAVLDDPAPATPPVAASEAVTRPAPGPATAAPQHTAPVWNPETSAAATVAAVRSGGGRKRRERTILITLLVVLLVAGVGGAAYLIGSRSSDDEQAAGVEDGQDARDTTDAPSGDASEDPSAAAPSESAVVPAEDGDEDGDEDGADQPPGPVTVTDPSGDQQLQNSGPRVSVNGDIAQVRVIPEAAGEPGWILVQFVDDTGPGGAVILNLDVDGDRSPDFIVWQDQSTGEGGSFATDDWQHGHDIVERGSAQDARFDVAAGPPPETGVAFPMRFLPGDLAQDQLRVNVQVINGDKYYDYSPGRHGWSRLVTFRAAR